MFSKFDQNLNNNLFEIKKYRPELFELLKGRERISVGQLIETREVPTFKYDMADNSSLYAYSIENPLESTGRMLSDTIERHSKNPIVYVGFGLGYAADWIIKKRPGVPFLVVIEPSVNLFFHALQASDLSLLIQSEKVFFLIGELKGNQFTKVLDSLVGGPLRFISHKPSLIWKPDLYNNTWNEVLAAYSGNASGRRFFSEKGEILFANKIANLKLLQHTVMVDCLKGLFQNRPAVIVAAGPSLRSSLPALKEFVGRIVIIAVDAALAPLLREKIIPDFVVTVDPNSITFEKFSFYLYKEWPFSLVASANSTPLITKRFECRHLFLSFPENDSQTWIHSNLGINEMMPAASAVSHLALGLAILLGAAPCIFIGYDFAYTDMENSHVSGALVSIDLKLSNQNKSFLEDLVSINGINGEEYSTHVGYLSQKKQLEEIIRSNPGVYINSTSKGAIIEGTTTKSLEAVLKKFATCPFPVGSIVEDAVKNVKSPLIQNFIQAGRNLISMSITRQQDVATILNLIDELKHSLLQFKNIRNADGLPSSFIKQINELEQYDKKLLLSDNETLWLYLHELAFSDIEQNNQMVKANQKVRDIHFAKWLEKEIDIMASRYNTFHEKLAIFAVSLNALFDHLEFENSFFERKFNNYEDYLKLSEFYVESGEMQLAKNILEEAQSHWVDSAKAFFLLGIVNSSLLDFDSAIQNWSKAVDGDPLFESRILEFRDKEASFWLEKAKFGFGPINDFCKRVITLAGGRDWVKKEVEACWGTLDFDPKQTDFYVIKKILNDIKPFREIFPQWYFISSKLSAAKKNFKDAISLLNKAISIKPDHAEWTAVLARYFIEADMFEEGIQTLKEAVSLNPEAAVLWEELGDLLFDAGDYESSGIAYEYCFLALPGKLTSLRKLGDSYLAMNKPEAAISAYDEVLRKEADNEIAQKNRLLAVKQL